MEALPVHENTALTFGPVPSRRLGRSLGINNIPPKICSYACVYCQVGATTRARADRRPYFRPSDIANAATRRLQAAREAGESVDYLTFVPDGEPTLDAALGWEIDLLRPLGVKIAVITNATLLDRPDVREDLRKADWVSLKVDAVAEATWRRVNCPHRGLSLPALLEGMLAFAREYAGELVTETMLVSGVNEGEADLEAVAQFLAVLNPATAYVSVPTRPPARPWAHVPSIEAVTRAGSLLRQRLAHVVCLTEEEDAPFVSTGDVAEDILGITAVHPMTEDALRCLLEERHAAWSLVDDLLGQGRLAVVEHEGRRFYRRVSISERLEGGSYA